VKGIFTALSGAMAQNDRLDTIANNIANVNTPGFKKDEQTFREYLTSYEKQDNVITVPRIPASIESFYDMQGGDKSYVDTAGSFTDHSQGGLKQTGNALDVALEGSGFLEVLMPQGVGYARNGSMTLDGQGRLVTHQGFPVLREGTEDPAQRVIQLTGSNVQISPDGEVELDGAVVARLSAVDINNKDALAKVGSSLYQVKQNMNPEFRPSEVKFHQGYLETSNVNLVNEMTNMITATRTFETNQKAIQAYDQINGKLVNEVSRLG
jgi:flagellar basal-body rod protein FlgF